MEKPDFKIIEADDVITLETPEILKNLFPRDPKLEEELAEDMRQKGYDPSQPIIVWKKQDADGSVHLIIVDGYTRFYAGIKAHVSILIVEKEFANEDEAIRFAYRCQLKRRNLTTAQMMEYAQRFENLSSRQVAKELGISPSHAQRIRKIIREGRFELQKAVKDGEKSVYSAAEEMREVPGQPQGQKEEPASIDSPQDKGEAEEVPAVPNTPQDEKEQPTSTDTDRNEEEVEKKSYGTYLSELKEDIKNGKKPGWEMDREYILSNHSQKEIEKAFSGLERELDILFLYDEERLMTLLSSWIKKHFVPEEVAQGN